MDEDFDETTTNACLIAAGHRVGHCEIAACGTLIVWARAMAEPGPAEKAHE